MAVDTAVSELVARAQVQTYKHYQSQYSFKYFYYEPVDFEEIPCFAQHQTRGQCHTNRSSADVIAQLYTEISTETVIPELPSNCKLYFLHSILDVDFSEFMVCFVFLRTCCMSGSGFVCVIMQPACASFSESTKV